MAVIIGNLREERIAKRERRRAQAWFGPSGGCGGSVNSLEREGKGVFSAVFFILRVYMVGFSLCKLVVVGSQRWSLDLLCVCVLLYGGLCV